MSELEQLRQESEQLKNQIRVSLIMKSKPFSNFVVALEIGIFVSSL